MSAVGPRGRLAPYSSFGPEIAIAAPGGDKSQGEEAGVLQQTLAEGSTTESAYRWFQGTSMATPHVAGAAALVMSLGVSAPGAVEEVLRSTAQDAPDGNRERYGAGLLDAAAAVRKATLWWGLWRLAFGVFGTWFALRHARAVGQIRASEKAGPLFWVGLGAGAGALAMLAPFGGERIPLLSFLALPPAAWPQRFLGPLAGYVGWSALVASAADCVRRGRRGSRVRMVRHALARRDLADGGSALDAGVAGAVLAAGERPHRLDGWTGAAFEGASAMKVTGTVEFRDRGEMGKFVSVKPAETAQA